MFTINSNFIYLFNRGDQIMFNVVAIGAFHQLIEHEDKDSEWIKATRSPSTGELLRKPYNIAIAAVIEAAMLDFLIRAAAVDTRFSFPYLDYQHRINLSKKITRKTSFQQSVEYFEKYALLGNSSSIYNQLKRLIDIRNDVHIIREPSAYYNLNRSAFSYNSLALAEGSAEFVLKFLSQNFSRGAHYHYVSDFNFPWKERYDKIPEYKKIIVSG